MTVVAIVMLTLVVCVVVGVPLALLVSGSRSWSVLAADSVLAGFVLLGLVPTLYGWLGAVGLALAVIGWLAAIVAVVLRRRGLPPRPRLDRSAVVLLVAGLIVGVVALSQRLHVVNFLPWLGDMGAYVNWGNRFARTGELSSAWPPLLPSFFGASGAAFGIEWTTVPLAASGLVLIVAVARLLHMLRVNRWIVLAAAAVVALHAHAVWYSNFPASEALNAPYFTIWLLTLLGGLRAVRPVPWIAASGVLMLVLGLLRGTGPMLLVPIIAAVVAALVVRDWRHFSPRLWGIFTANVVATMIAYWYGISEIRFYYIEFQLSRLMPAALFDAIDPLTHPGPLVAVILAVIAAALIAVMVWWTRHPPQAHRRTVGARVVIVLAVVVFAGGVGATAIVGTGTWDVLLRMGWWLGLGVVGALLLAAGPRVPRSTVLLALIAATPVILFYGFHTRRLGLGHSFYIYWDRYLVSEALPAMIVLAGLAVELLRRRALVRWPDAGWMRPRVVAPLAVVATAALISLQVPALMLLGRDTFMADAYRFQTALESHVDDRETPIVWAATDDRQVPGFFFPNTFMAFARPMIYTSGLNVVRVSVRPDDFSPDEVLDATAVSEALGCSATGEVLVYELRNGGAGLADRVDAADVGANGVVIDLVATEAGRLEFLSQPPTAGWMAAEFTVDVWRVSGSSTAACVR